MFDEKCGCGRPVRYTDLTTGKGACNKYKRCLDYEELEKRYNLLVKLRYCVASKLEEENNQNFGHAKEWDRHIIKANEEYEEYVNGQTK